MENLINVLNIYLSQMHNYINDIKLTMSAAKSTLTLFTPDTHEHHLHPHVKQADQVLTHEKKPKVLGVTLDTQLILTQHYNNIAVTQQCEESADRLYLGLRHRICANDLPNNWPFNIQLLLPRLDAITQGHLLEPAPTGANKLALSIATGCLQMEDVAELHEVVQELPVRQHNEVISQQFALACHQPQHHCHQLYHRLHDDRSDRRRSPIGRFEPNIQQYLAEKPLTNTSYV